jgi:hypothetical protein
VEEKDKGYKWSTNLLNIIIKIKWRKLRGGKKDDMEAQVARKATWKHQGKIGGHSATLVSNHN